MEFPALLGGPLAPRPAPGSSRRRSPCFGAPGPSAPAQAPAMSAKNAAAGGGDGAGGEPAGIKTKIVITTLYFRV